MTRQHLVLALMLMLAGWSMHTVVSQGQPTPVSSTLDDATIAELGERVSRFLEGVSLGEIESAYDELLVGSRLAAQENAIQSFVEKTRQIEGLYGKFDSFERVDAKRVGRDLVLLKYLYKSEDFPVVWYFTFYRTTGNSGDPLGGLEDWKVITLRFDTQFELLGL